MEELKAQIKALEAKVDKVDTKLDLVIETKTAIGYLKWVIGAAWGAIAAMAMHHVK